MHADAHYVIGSTHGVCEDYALAVSVGERAFAVVCDGCSSSANSDVGARLLAAAAAATLREGRFDLPQTLTKAHRALHALELDETALDATLLVAYATDDIIEVRCFGDGIVAARQTDGTLVHLSIGYVNAAPDYPSYQLNALRRRSFDRQLRSPRTLEGPLVDAAEVTDHVRLVLPRSRYHCVAILSDGASAVTESNGDLVAVESVLGSLALASGACPNGAFVHRRLRRWVRRVCPAANWTPNDDVAAAVIRW